MKNPAKFLFENIVAIIKHISGTKKPPLVRCQFCGELGHDIEGCSTASKYKLFHVDRD